MEIVRLTNLFKCPIVDCKFHNKVIEGSLSLLKNHIFRDHDYFEKLKTAVKLEMIKGIQERRSSKWLSDHLAVKGIL